MTNSTKKIKSSITVFVLLSLVWIALTGTNKSDIILGISVSALLSVMFSNVSSVLSGLKLTPSLIVYAPYYIIILLIEIVKSNVDVASRVISPRLPINPAIVKIKTELKSDIGKLVLANSITLTPGTLTIDVKGDIMYIHCIDTKEKNIEDASKNIAGHFEKILRKIFE